MIAVCIVGYVLVMMATTVLFARLGFDFSDEPWPALGVIAWPLGILFGFAYAAYRLGARWRKAAELTDKRRELDAAQAAVAKLEKKLRAAEAKDIAQSNAARRSEYR